MEERQQKLFNLAVILAILLLVVWYVSTAKAQTNMGAIRTPQVNQTVYVGQSGFSTIQATVNFACSTGTRSYAVTILPGMTPPDNPANITGGCTGSYIADLRVVPFLYYIWNGAAYTPVSSSGTFPNNSVVYGMTPNTARPATYHDIAAMWGCTGTLNSDGSCSTPGSGGGAGGTGPQNKAAVYNGTGTGGSYAQGHANWGQGATANDLTVPGQTWSQQFGLNEYSATGTSSVPPAPGNNGSNGIQTAQNLIGANGPGAVHIEPNYSTWEQSIIDTATNDRMLWIDERQGRFHIKSQNPGLTGGGNANLQFDCLVSKNLGSTDYTGAPPSKQTCISTVLRDDVPGFYHGALAGNPSGWFGETIWDVYAEYSSAAMNHSLITAALYTMGRGDTQTIDLTLDNEYGGMDASADEGNHIFRIVSNIGAHEFTGQLWKAGEDHGTQGYKKLYLANQNGGLGVLRHLLNNTTGILTDTVTAGTINSDQTSTLTMTNSSYPVSIVTTTTVDIAPPLSTEQTKFSMTFTVNTLTSLSSHVGQQAQFAGNDSQECGKIQSAGTLSGGIQQVTMMLSEHHYPGDKLYVGGMACRFMVTDNSVQAITHNAHTTYYVLGSTANNKLIVANKAQGGLVPYINGTPGPVHIYQGARVLDVRCSATCGNGAIPGQDSQEVRVEDTGAPWNTNDFVLSGMIAQSQADNIYYALTDDNPMTSGATYKFVVADAQMGGYIARDFMWVQNLAPDSAYTWGGGQFSIGDIIHWNGAVGNVIVLDNQMHGAMFTDFYCGWIFARTNNAGINEKCPGTMGGPDGATLGYGWTIQGDTQILSSSGDVNKIAAQFSFEHGNRINSPTIATLGSWNGSSYVMRIQAPPDYSPTVASPYFSFVTASTHIDPGFAVLPSPSGPTYTMVALNNRYTAATHIGFQAIGDGTSDDTLYFDTPAAGGYAFRENEQLLMYLGGTTNAFQVFNATGTNTATMDKAGNLTLTSLTCTGTPCGSGTGGGSVPANITAQTLALSGPPVGSGYDLNVTDSGSSQAFIGTTNSGTYAVLRFGNDVSEKWQFAVGGSATGGVASNWYVYDEGISGSGGAGQVMMARHGTGTVEFNHSAIVDTSLAVASTGVECNTGVLFCVGGTTRTPALFKVDTSGNVTVTSLSCTGTPCGSGAAATKPAAPTSLSADILTARRNCKGHGPGEIWADNENIYHCRADGTGYGRATLANLRGNQGRNQ
jgi:hypothetical protein